MHSKSSIVLGDWAGAGPADFCREKPGWSEWRSGKETEKFGSEGKEEW